MSARRAPCATPPGERIVGAFDRRAFGHVLGWVGFALAGTGSGRVLGAVSLVAGRAVRVISKG